MLDFLRRFRDAIRRPFFHTGPANPLPPEPVLEPPQVFVPPLPTFAERRARLNAADLRLHVSIEDTHRGAKIEYHVGPANHPFQNRFADRTVSYKIPERFLIGLREHFLQANEFSRDITVPTIGSIDYQFERYPEDSMRVAISGLYNPKSDLRFPARGKLGGIGAYLELKALGHLKKMGITHLRTSYQMVSEKREDQLWRRGLEKGKTYTMKEWARRLSSPPRPRLYRAA